MLTRRTFMAAGAAALVLSGARNVYAGQPVVEIISLPHWPVQAALKPIRGVLAKFGSRIRVIELNADETDGRKRLKSIGLRGHVPAVILIDGMYRFKRADGSVVEFLNFPAQADSPMGLSGAWSAKDVEAALLGRLNGQ